MQFRKRVLSATILLVLILSACTSAAATPAAMKDVMPQATEANMDDSVQNSQIEPGSKNDQSTNTDSAMSESGGDSMMDDHSGDAMSSESSMMSGNSSNMMEAPAWISATLTNAATGETFSVSNFEGKVVLVETMAIWCSNCLQQRQVKELHNLLGMRDDFVSLGLDVDPNEDTQALQEYTAKNGFDWSYAVSPADVSRQLGQLYTDQFLNPTSTPMLIIDRHGAAHPLSFGIKSAADLQSALEPFLNEGM